MKSLFIFRDSFDARYILDSLERKKILNSFILEKGKEAKEKKLKKLFKKTPVYYYPFLVLDLAALYFYSAIMIRKMAKKMGNFEYPIGKKLLTIDNVNDKLCISYIKDYNPDIVFIYGTSILTKSFLQSFKAKIFNIHTGILPNYRNVHSDFWVYKNKDYNNAGVSIIYVDEGIDTGDIGLEKKISIGKNDSLTDIKVKNLVIIPNMIEQVIKEFKNKKLKRKKQNKRDQGFFNTPKFIDILKLVTSFYYEK